MAIQFLTDVNADSGTLYVDSINDRVGIGTTGPGSALDVVGSIRTTNSSGNQASFTGSSLTFPDASTTTIGANIVNFNPGTKNLAIGSSTTKWDAVNVTSNTYRWTSGGFGNAGELNISSSSMDVDVLLKIEDQVNIENLANATSDTDKFLVSDPTQSDRVKYRTGAQLAADIGAVTGGPFLPLAPTGTDVITGDVRIAENKYFRFGASANAGGSLIIGHTNFGSPVSQILENGTGDLKISATNLILESANEETYIDCNFNSSVDLYHNNVKKFETTSTGVGVTGNATFLDSGKAIFGTGSDLEIYNDGSNSYFDNKTAGQNIIFNVNELSGTPEFKIINTTSGDPFAVFNKSSFTVYEDGSEIIKANSSAVELTNSLDLKSYTATAVATTGSLNANQNFQAPTQDTLATLCVDPSGNVVRGSQEGTWTFTRAQLNATLGNTLIAAPGANKFIVVEESAFMVRFTGTSGSNGPTLEIRQADNNAPAASIARFPGDKIAFIMNQPGGGAGSGIYGRDVPTGSDGARTYRNNQATTLHKLSSGSYVSNLTSISIKLKYRIYNESTF